MRKARVLIGLLAAPVLALGAVAPAATAAPLPASARAAHAAPGVAANLTRCDIRFNACRIIDNTAHPRFINGTVHDHDLFGELTGTYYIANVVSPSMTNVFVITDGILCWDVDTRNGGDHVAMESCPSPPPLGEQWAIVPVNDANHDSEIVPLETVGPGHPGVNCCDSGSPGKINLTFANPAPSTALWYWVN
jgi:hypothetical protein